MNIYVGNLPHATTDTELREAFDEFGLVSTVSLMKDKFTGQPRGFAFVEMPTKGEAEAAIAELNGRALGGRPLTVNEARPREKRSSTGFGNRRNSGDHRRD
jgi:RNA recognition motif-containing protein